MIEETLTKITPWHVYEVIGKEITVMQTAIKLGLTHDNLQRWFCFLMRNGWVKRATKDKSKPASKSNNYYYSKTSKKVEEETINAAYFYGKIYKEKRKSRAETPVLLLGGRLIKFTTDNRLQELQKDTEKKTRLDNKNKRREVNASGASLSIVMATASY